MSGRVSANHLALAYDDLIRRLWRAMHQARERRNANPMYGDHPAALLSTCLNVMLQVRSDARRDYVSLPNPSTVAFRREQDEADDQRADDNSAYLRDQLIGIQRAMQ